MIMRIPTRRQIVFNWVMGETDLMHPDGYWGTSEEVANVGRLLDALDKLQTQQYAAAEPLPICILPGCRCQGIHEHGGSSVRGATPRRYINTTEIP